MTRNDDPLVHPQEDSPEPLELADVRMIVDSPHAPPVLALAIAHELDRSHTLHRHASGQLYCLHQGVMMVKTDSGIFANPPRLVGWIPPGHEHSVSGGPQMTGWTVFLHEKNAASLPKHPALLRCSALVEPVAQRLAQYLPHERQGAAYRRLSGVFMDELRTAQIQGPSLPLPLEPRLRRIAMALIGNPADSRTGPALAKWAGISERSLSRLWTPSTGMSISKYRQIARVLGSLEALSQGRGIQNTAWDVGFESVGAYINAFKDFFGFTPGRYMAQQTEQ